MTRAGVFVHQLPEFKGSPVPGERLVNNVIRSSLVLCVVGVVAAGVLAATVKIDVVVNGAGAIEAGTTVPVRVLQPGVVKAIHVQTGDSVREGQLLLSLDPLDLASRRKDVESQIAQRTIQRARSVTARPGEAAAAAAAERQGLIRVDRAKAALRERLAAFGLPGQVDSVVANHVEGVHTGIDLGVADIRGAESDLAVARVATNQLHLRQYDVDEVDVTLRQLRHELADIDARIARLFIRAPVAGTLVTDRLNQLVGSAVQAGAPVLEVQHSEQWRVSLWVAADGVHEIRPGLPVDIEVAALRSRRADRMRGVVTAAMPALASANGDAGQAGYRVTVDLDLSAMPQVADWLRTGYPVTGHIVTRQATAFELARKDIARVPAVTVPP